LKIYPAIVVQHADPDLVAGLVDDFSPTAIEPRIDDIRVFFTSTRDRDSAQRVLAERFDVSSEGVPDDDWARRSQENLQPVTVGAVTVVASRPPNPRPTTSPSSLTIVIVPSMGFGTGHHITTRLCLEALQTLDLARRTVLDVGTGSGVLAIAAVLLGGLRAIGIDSDADAIQSARENLALNPDADDRVTFLETDVMGAPLPAADVVTANLTGALLVRAANRLSAALSPGGVLILSGMLAGERDDVRRAFHAMPVVWEREEDGWVGAAMKKS
jgi:ribosomal protein L11 methyltransferase